MCTINKITKHAMERYSERIMDKDNKIDVNLFITQNEDKIKNDIQKMIDFGDLIYSGKPLNALNGNKNLNKVDVYIKDLWIILIDSKTKDCITLYRIDLGVGDDFDKEFVSKMMNKLKVAKSTLTDKETDIQEQCANYRNMISDNEEQIKQYETYIKTLRKLNEDYNDTITTLQQTRNIAEEEVRTVVGNLIGKKVF